METTRHVLLDDWIPFVIWFVPFQAATKRNAGRFTILRFHQNRCIVSTKGSKKDGQQPSSTTEAAHG